MSIDNGTQSDPRAPDPAAAPDRVAGIASIPPARHHRIVRRPLNTHETMITYAHIHNWCARESTLTQLTPTAHPVVKPWGTKYRVQFDTGGSPRARAGGRGRICSGLASLSSAATALGGVLVVCSAPARRPASCILSVQQAGVAVWCGGGCACVQRSLSVECAQRARWPWRSVAR